MLNNYNLRSNGNARMSKEELEFQRALNLSKQTFDAETKRRKEENRIAAEKAISAAAVVKRRKPWDKQTAFSTFLSVMEWQPKLVRKSVGVGMRNLGNSCFMNAVIQCLTYTPPLAQLMLQYHHSPICEKRRNKEFCALCTMESVIPTLHTSKDVIGAYQLFKNLAFINDLLTPGCQEDAHEFAQSLLFRMEDEYDSNYKKVTQKKTDPFNPVTRLFSGSMKTEIMCGGCHGRTSTEEPFNLLSLDVAEADSLYESLCIFSNDELMQGDNKYFCENCERKRVARKKTTISKLPPIFVFHLKRFKVQPKSYASHHREKRSVYQKIAHHVEFPFMLDLGEKSPYIHPDDQLKFENGDRLYSLYAVLVHSGPQLGYGHYYALVKAPDGTWFRMNDTQVLPIQEARVLKEQGYLLFYQRTTHKEFGAVQPPSANNVPASLSLSQVQEELELKQETEEISLPIETDLMTNDYFEATNCGSTNDTNPNDSSTSSPSSSSSSSSSSPSLKDHDLSGTVVTDVNADSNAPTHQSSTESFQEVVTTSRTIHVHDSPPNQVRRTPNRNATRRESSANDIRSEYVNVPPLATIGGLDNDSPDFESIIWPFQHYNGFDS